MKIVLKRYRKPRMYCELQILDFENETLNFGSLCIRTKEKSSFEEAKQQELGVQLETRYINWSEI